MDGRPPWLRDRVLGQRAGTVGKEVWNLGLERRVPWALTVECQTAQGIHKQDQGATAQGCPARVGPIVPSPSHTVMSRLPTICLSAPVSGGPVC